MVYLTHKRKYADTVSWNTLSLYCTEPLPHQEVLLSALHHCLQLFLQRRHVVLLPRVQTAHHHVMPPMLRQHPHARRDKLLSALVRDSQPNRSFFLGEPTFLRSYTHTKIGNLIFRSFFFLWECITSGNRVYYSCIINLYYVMLRCAMIIHAFLCNLIPYNVL